MTRIDCWLDHSCKRVYPATPAKTQDSIDLIAARGERISFLACAKNPDTEPVTVEVEVRGCGELEAAVRRIGYVPVKRLTTSVPLSDLEGLEHIPGFVPDPIFPESSALLGPFESHAFLVTVKVPENIEPGMKTLVVSFSWEGSDSVELDVELEVSPLVIKPLKDFPVTHWVYLGAFCDWYEVEPSDERFWSIVKEYMKNLVERRTNCIFTPLFYAGGKENRPRQLLKVGKSPDGRYEFDFSDVLKWVRTAQSVGAEYFEWSHLFSSAGVERAVTIYSTNAEPYAPLWPRDTASTDAVYWEFLAQFLPAFHTFLTREDLVKKSFFHLSDEPHGEEALVRYKKVRAMIRELAPWMKTIDALSEIEYGREGIVDVPVVHVGFAQPYIDEGIPAWVYYSCCPRGRFLNRFLDTPLAKIRMSGWLFYKLRAAGFLHWGYNYWFKREAQQLIDPFTEQSGAAWPAWPYGDTFVVYPGEDGPIDSLRWEAFAESLQDYALLQSAGVDPDAEFLSSIKSYEDFPISQKWIADARRAIL